MDNIDKMSFIELRDELHKQEILYNTEENIDKANQANWKMTVLLNKMHKIQKQSYRVFQKEGTI